LQIDFLEIQVLPPDVRQGFAFPERFAIRHSRSGKKVA